MVESPNAHRRNRILELGVWRDQGRLFAVGLDGEVSKHEELEREHDHDPGQWQGSPAASPAPAASDAEPAGSDGRASLTDRYLGFRPEILRYYPTAHFHEVEHGLWIVATIFPLGRHGPCYWVCLFLPDHAAFSSKAFAFSVLGRHPKPVGPRHTNFPDGSICAFTDEDDAWRPGDNPKILLNLYAEWLICQLFLAIEHRWPGRQIGLDATYRQEEFGPREWCHCNSGERYGVCHYKEDAEEVARLKANGAYEQLPKRIVPATIMQFAASRWRKLPDIHLLGFHRYMGQPPRHFSDAEPSIAVTRPR